MGGSGMNMSNMPHSRGDCTSCRFDPVESVKFHDRFVALSSLTNAKHCPKCYCYVCDIPAAQCLEVSSTLLPHA